MQEHRRKGMLIINNSTKLDLECTYKNQTFLQNQKYLFKPVW